MNTQATTPADAGGNTNAGDASQDTNDGFADLDALASAAAETNSEPVADEDGITDWDATPLGAGEGNEADAEKAKAEAEKAKGEGDDGKKVDEEKKRLSGAQRAKQQRNQLLDQIAERDRQIAELQKGTKPAGENAGDGPKAPKEEDFNGDWFAWQRALTAFEAGETARKAAADVLKSREGVEQRERVQREARERRDAHLDRVEAARAVIADYDAVMEGMKGVSVRDASINEIMSSEKSELISYHFATNPDELTAFDSMSPREQAREIGRLEATLKLPEPKKATTAPPPLSKPKGGAAPPQDQTKQLNSWLDKKYGKNRPR